MESVSNAVGELKADREWSLRTKQQRMDQAAKKSKIIRLISPVPQTDTGRRGENPKVRERTLVKELGKKYP